MLAHSGLRCSHWPIRVFTSAEKDARGSATLAPPTCYRLELGVWAGLGVEDSRQVPSIHMQKGISELRGSLRQAGGLTQISSDDSLHEKKRFSLSGVNGQMDSHWVSHRARGPNSCADGEKNEPRAGGACLIRMGACPLLVQHLADTRIPRATKAPEAKAAWRLGMVVAATRTLATFQSNNDQKLGRKLSVEEIRTKAVECQGQCNPGTKYHAKMTRHGNGCLRNRHFQLLTMVSFPVAPLRYRSF